MKQLAIALFAHEGNSFSPVPTDKAAFRARFWTAGAAARDLFAGTRTELGAAVDFLASRPDWRGTFLTCAEAGPAGPVTAAAYRAILDEIVAGLGQRRWDGVYLALHGAMLADGDPTADVTTLAAVRAAIGRTPLAVSFDLHAHLGQPQLELFDVAVGYKTHPHVDLYETGAKALRLLDAMVAGRVRPRGALVKIPAILPSINMRTTDGPMAETVALAADIEAARGLLDISVFGGFSYGDTPFAGGSVLVHADGDAAAARQAAEAVAAAMTERLGRFYIRLPEPAEAIALALAAPPGPVALVEGSDNPGSGGIGDTTGLLRALVDRGAEVPTVFAFFNDPGVVARAHGAGVGARLDVALGGRISSAFGAPIPLTLTVERLTDGRFRNVGPMATHAPTDLGRTALLGDGHLRVIVTEQCVTPNDPGFFDLHGIDLAAVRLLAVKAKNHFRAGFRDRVATMIDVDTAGPAALDLRRFAFKLAPAALRRA